MTISFRYKLLATHAAVALIVGAVTLVIVERLVSRRMEAQLDARLEAQARAAATWLERAAHPQQLARRLSGVVDARVTIIDKDGIALGESTAPSDMRPQMDRDGEAPEVRVARAGQVGRDTRFAPLDEEYVRYVAVPAAAGTVVRLGVPLDGIAATQRELRMQLLAAAAASLVVAFVLATAIAGRLTRRLRDATLFARRIGAGTYDGSPVPASSDEIGVLTSTLATAAGELAATEKRRRELLANVAHEIRTPVTSIRGYAELLTKGPVEAETSREFLQTIHRNSLRITQLVEDLLELEALDAGTAPALARETVGVAPVVSNVIETLTSRAAEGAATLVAPNIAPDLSVTGDEDALERILLNLVDNALRHGGKGVHVELRAERRGERVAITVVDDGPGVPVEHRSRIFERLYRGDAHLDRERRGSGLGLAIASELAHAMGGTLVLEGGAAFVLELPS